MAEPVTKCGTCGIADDEPKHQILVGFNNPNTGGAMFHGHDFEREGMIFYHFGCASEWHSKVAPEAQAAHARICTLAASGVHGDELRSRIQAGDF
jgi:hypothetical protein